MKRSRKHPLDHLNDDLRDHLERETAENIARGMSPEDARSAALRKFGNPTRIAEEARAVWHPVWLEQCWQDLRYGLRGLRRSPGFAAVVVLTLALGIGANTAIFTLMDAVMWRLLPVEDPESVLVPGLVQDGRTVATGLNYVQFRTLHDDNDVAIVAGYTTAPVNISIEGAPEPALQAQLVSGEYFPLLGVGAAIGRTLGPEDDVRPNGHPVAMLSYRYWEARFGGDPEVIGRTIRVSDTPFTVIGVTPREFFGVEAGINPDLFLPLMMQPTAMPAYENLLENPIVNRNWVKVVARPRAGLSREQAEAVLDARAQVEVNRLRELTAQRAAAAGIQYTPPPPVRLVLRPATELSDLRQQFSRPLAILLAMVGIILLIACANTANLMLARASARGPEFAVRGALGAGRGRITRQLLVEGLALAALGGLCGVVLARWSTQLLVVFLSSGRTPLFLDLNPNPRILAFTAAVTLLTGILFGSVPALRAGRMDLAPSLKSHRGSPIGARAGMRPGRILLVLQVALSVLLVVAAGLFIRSLQGLSGSDPAVSRESVVVARVEPRGSDQRGIPGTTERLDRLYRELLARTAEIPGVVSVGMAQVTPSGELPSGRIPMTADGEPVAVPTFMAYPGYFATVGMELAAGRVFSDADLGENAPAVCLVNEALVRRFFPDQNPLGQPCMVRNRPRLGPVRYAADDPPEAYTIVGILRDSRYTNPTGEPHPVAYMTFLQTPTGRGQMALYVRVSGDAGAFIPRIREAVAAVDPTMPMFDVHTLEQEMDAALVQNRLIALLSGLFGGLALLLASVGLYGLLAFAVVQRTGEMGIRMALGAGRAGVLWLVIREALRLVTIGIAIGIPAAVAASRLASAQISGLLFGIESTDPANLAVAGAVLIAVALAAAYLPARRASRIDPMAALRHE